MSSYLKTKLFYIILFSLNIFLFNSSLFSQTVLSDNLKGNTIGKQNGGSFTSEGYRPGTGNKHISYTVSNAPTNGYVQFEVKGFRMADFPRVSPSNVLDNSTFVVMYDGRGISNPLNWAPDYRNNFFRWGIYYLGPKYNNPNSGDRFKSKMLIAAPSRVNKLTGGKAVFPYKSGTRELDLDWKSEPSGVRTSWNANQWYVIRISWDNDKRDYKVFRGTSESNLQEVWNVKKGAGAGHDGPLSSPFPRIPGVFKVNLGSGPGELQNYMPNLVYRNFKVVKTSGGSTGPVNTFSVSTSSQNVNSNQGTTSFSVFSNVSWTVKSLSSWLTASPSSGSNNGTVTARFTENSSTSSRTGTIEVTGNGITEQVKITQAGKTSSTSNSLTISKSSQGVGASKGSTSFTVSSNVSWTVSSPSWITTSPSSGSNNGTVTANFAENTSTSSRSGAVIVSGGNISRTFNITQAGKAISGGGNYLNVPASLSFPKEQGSLVVDVSSNVSWRVYDNTGSPGWIGKTPKSGTGNGKVTVKYYANTSSSSRTGTLVFEGGGMTKTIALTQAGASSSGGGGGNSLSVTPSSPNVGSAAGSQVFGISSNVNWIITNNSTSWITTSPSSGSNNGSVTAKFSANTSTSSRTGTFTVVGGGITRTINVIQSGKSNTSGGNYLDVPATLSFAKDQGSMVVDVSSNVSWRVYDNTGSPGWVGKTPKTGTGNGKVTVRYRANTSPNSRTGTLTFESGGMKKIVNMTQAGTSSVDGGSEGTGKYLNVPEEFNLTGSPGNFTVNVSSNISWTVKDNAGSPGWIGKSPKTGTGDGRVGVRYYANTTGKARSADLIFWGEGLTKIVKVNQSASVALAKTNGNSEDIFVEEVVEVPKKFSVSNYPNPFNPTTTIRFALPEAAYTELTVYNTLGQEVKKLVSDFKSEGIYNVTFNATNLASGIYFYTVRSGKFVQTHKILLLE